MYLDGKAVVGDDGMRHTAEYRTCLTSHSTLSIKLPKPRPEYHLTGPNVFLMLNLGTSEPIMINKQETGCHMRQGTPKGLARGCLMAQKVNQGCWSCTL